MDTENIWDIAKKQLAVDFNCSPEDFSKSGDTVVLSRLNAGAKCYYTEALFCNFAFWGQGLVACADERIKPFIEEYAAKNSGFRAFDMPQINDLNRELNRYGRCIMHIAEFFLPCTKERVFVNDALEIKIFEGGEISKLYADDRFHNALEYDLEIDKKRDVIAAVGYLNGEIAGVAGASGDCGTMWQIGVDTLPEFRRQGVAKTLTKRLSDEIIARGVVPFYCTAWSNIASKANAVSGGYKTAWVEMTAKEIPK